MPKHRRTATAIAAATLALAGLGSAAATAGAVSREGVDVLRYGQDKYARISYDDQTDLLCVKTNHWETGTTKVTMTSQRYGAAHQISTVDRGGDNVRTCITKPGWRFDSYVIRGSYEDGFATGYFYEND